MGIPRIDLGPMTLEEFYAFTDARPGEEKWELIDGEPILNAAPSDFHQLILASLIEALGAEGRRISAPWRAIPGIGARISETSRPEPDLMILPKRAERDARPRRDTTEAIAMLEIMSPSTAARDLKWKRTAYVSLPALTHYVIVAQDAVDVVMFARDDGFAEQRYRSPADILRLSLLGISMPVSEIYRDTGLA
jgi:Uma2 family endonuclease